MTTVWACVYCGKHVNEGCPHENTFACCGEVGHVVEVDAETGEPVDSPLLDKIEDVEAMIVRDEIRKGDI